MHDASKVLLGASRSTDREITCEAADPASFPAGLAVRRASSVGGLSLSSGQLIGVSMGRDLSDTAKTAVARTGLQIPLKVFANAVLVEGDLTFTAVTPGVVGEEISIEFLDTGTAGAEVVTVVGKAISVSMEDGVSTATQLKAALDAKAEALALITTAIASGQGAVAQDAFAEDNLADGDAPFVVIGAAVYLHPTLGYGVASGFSGAVATGAVYRSAILTGIDPISGAEVQSYALVDMPGGF